MPHNEYVYDESQFSNEKENQEKSLNLLTAYQQAVDVNIISSITDTYGTILHVNDKFCQVSKYSKNELIGQNHRIINSGYHTESFFSQMWQTINKGGVWQNEIKNKAKDGSFYWVDTVILPILDKEKNISRYLSLRTLINEKKEAEEERKEYTKKLNEMLYLTSHKIRAPLATCMGLMNLVDSNKTMNEQDLKKVVTHLKSSALELDEFSKELTILIHGLEKKYGRRADNNQD